MQKLKFLARLIQLTILTYTDPLFTEWAEAKIKKDTRCKPFYFKPFFKAFYMKYMATLTHDTRSSRKCLYITNCAILISIYTLQSLLICLSTFFIHAGKAFFFTFISIARMPAWINFAACHFCRLLTLGSITYIY
jgi:hypothetical protein